jgi:hypothetical protein
MKNLLITTLLFLSSVSLSHAGLFGPSNYEECVLENVKTAQTNRAVSVVMRMCQDKFPQKVIPVLPKLSKGIKSDLVCTTNFKPDLWNLSVDVINKKVMVNGHNGNITHKTKNKIYGVLKSKTGADAFFELEFLTGIFKLKLKPEINGTPIEDIEFACVEEV